MAGKVSCVWSLSVGSVLVIAFSSAAALGIDASAIKKTAIDRPQIILVPDKPLSAKLKLELLKRIPAPIVLADRDKKLEVLDSPPTAGNLPSVENLQLDRDFLCGAQQVVDLAATFMKRHQQQFSGGFSAETFTSMASDFEKEVRKTIPLLLGKGDKSVAEIWIPSVVSITMFWIHLAPLAEDYQHAMFGTLFQAISLLYFNANQNALQDRWKQTPYYNLTYANWWALRKTIALALLFGLSQDFFQGRFLMVYEGAFLANLMISSISDLTRAVRQKYPKFGAPLQSYLWNTTGKPFVSAKVLESFASLPSLFSSDHAEFVAKTAASALAGSYIADLSRIYVLKTGPRVPLIHETALTGLKAMAESLDKKLKEISSKEERKRMRTVIDFILQNKREILSAQSSDLPDNPAKSSK